MKRLLPFILLFIVAVAKSQTITGKVVDSTASKQLPYAIIIFHDKQKVVYTDVNGNFTLVRDSLTKNDTIIVQFLGYKKYLIPAGNLQNGIIIKLIPEPLELNPVIVTNCRKTAEFTLNKKVKRIRQYIGPGPETRLVIISRYSNVTGKNSYINKVSILIDEKSPNMQIPIRLRWYEWNLENKMPGKELTDTSIIVYPYKEGWNDFQIPAHTINCPKSWIVFGLEFIYPAEYKEQYEALQSSGDKIMWLSDMQNRWSLRMQYVKDENECGFYIVNNGEVLRYERKYDRYYIRPAVKFNIVYCKE